MRIPCVRVHCLAVAFNEAIAAHLIEPSARCTAGPEEAESRGSFLIRCYQMLGMSHSLSILQSLSLSVYSVTRFPCQGLMFGFPPTAISECDIIDTCDELLSLYRDPCILILMDSRGSPTQVYPRFAKNVKALQARGRHLISHLLPV